MGCEDVHRLLRFTCWDHSSGCLSVPWKIDEAHWPTNAATSVAAGGLESRYIYAVACPSDEG
jgi:hypothetical protein